MDLGDLLEGNKVQKPQVKRRSPVSTNQFSPQWRLRGSHLISNTPLSANFDKYCQENAVIDDKKVRVAAFDMDDTIICTKSDFKYGKGPYDWKWRNEDILPTLRAKVKQHRYVMAIFTNQASVSATQELKLTSKSYHKLTEKVSLVLVSLKNKTEIEALVFAAPGRPGKAHKLKSSEEQHKHYRKPEPGMWEELDLYIKGALGLDYSIDLEHSFYVGDAAGREGDHLADDKGFAENVGVRYHTPEEFFGR